MIQNVWTEIGWYYPKDAAVQDPYVALALKGYFPMEWLKTINVIGTNLPSHCDMNKTPGIDMTTGSLGQGISAAAGIALGNRLQGRDNCTFCIVGDGECNEGEVWEAVEVAVHRGPDHLIVFVDWNKKQLDGTLEQICKPMDFAEKFRAFGCELFTVKGYDVEDIYAGIIRAKQVQGKPSVIVLDTIKGIGCDFAEHAEFNHYMVVDWDMAHGAIAEIECRYNAGCFPGGEMK